VRETPGLDHERTRSRQCLSIPRIASPVVAGYVF
jgi:hypothetical protein